MLVASKGGIPLLVHLFSLLGTGRNPEETMTIEKIIYNSVRALESISRDGAYRVTFLF